MPDKNKQFTVTRTFNVPLELAWKAWSDSEQVKQWWGPTGFTCTRADIDFQEGGVSFVAMRASKEFGGGESYNTWTYEKITPMKHFSYVTRFTDEDKVAFNPVDRGFPAGIPKEVRSTNEFQDLGGKTKVTITEFGYSTEEAAHISQLGLEQCLDKMDAMFKK